jgi:hypothetical protein
MMQPELRQRFRDQICWLPPMSGQDYHAVSDRIAAALPDPRMREVWNRLSAPMIRRAIDGGLGMRVYEELMLAVLLESPGQPVQPPQTRPSFPPLI